MKGFWVLWEAEVWGSKRAVDHGGDAGEQSSLDSQWENVEPF